MSLTRVALAVAVAGAAATPVAAPAFVQYCTPPTSVAYVCHAPERPGCVYGTVGRAAFRTEWCG
ncbi:MAG TPA: hypothetical protein VF519_17820 [Mycobacteriales bacterium]|jgi:hypothetical protein